jgi:hypothetical protein
MPPISVSRIPSLPVQLKHKLSSNREGHSPVPFDRAPPNRSAHLLGKTGAMRTSGGFSAPYPAL